MVATTVVSDRPVRIEIGVADSAQVQRRARSSQRPLCINCARGGSILGNRIGERSDRLAKTASALR